MGFTAADVKNLREMTGVGMMDCKKALAEADGDIDKAVEWLREKGLAAAQKKAGRIAAEGMAYAYVCPECGVGSIVEVNAESDFVAKNDLFVEYVQNVAKVVAKDAPADLDALFACKYPGSEKTVLEEQNDKVLVIGENIKVRRFARYDKGVSVAYVHMAEPRVPRQERRLRGVHREREARPSPSGQGGSEERQQAGSHHREDRHGRPLQVL